MLKGVDKLNNVDFDELDKAIQDFLNSFRSMPRGTYDKYKYLSAEAINRIRKGTLKFSSISFKSGLQLLDFIDNYNHLKGGDNND